MATFDLVFYDVNRRIFLTIYYFFEITSSSELRQDMDFKMIRFSFFNPEYDEDSEKNLFEYIELILATFISLSLIYAEIKEE